MYHSRLWERKVAERECFDNRTAEWTANGHDGRNWSKCVNRLEMKREAVAVLCVCKGVTK